MRAGSLVYSHHTACNEEARQAPAQITSGLLSVQPLFPVLKWGTTGSAIEFRGNETLRAK